MNSQIARRTGALKGALAAMVLAAGLTASPLLVRNVYALSGGCSATCGGGGSCTAYPGPGERCTCGCKWRSGSMPETPQCSCTTALRENIPG